MPLFVAPASISGGSSSSVRYGGLAPSDFVDGALPRSLIVTKSWIALTGDAFDGATFGGGTVRYELSDVASMVLDQVPTAFTIVFDEQAEPLPKKDRRLWSRRAANNSSQWRLAAQSGAERDKAVGVIAKL